MDKIKINSYPNYFSTIVPNDFLDYYMPYANGDFVKVYLYVLRCLNSKLELTISIIADALNLTEADVIRAMKYWQEQNILKLEQHNNIIISITLLTPIPPTQIEQANNSLIKTTNITKSEIALTTTKPDYKPSEINRLAQNESIKQLIYITEKYIGKQLTHPDITILISLVDWLNLPIDLIEFLIEYCVTNNNRSLRYIEKVAIAWKENGINTIEKAKQYIQAFNKNYFAIMKSFGLNNRYPASSEIKFMEKWLNQYQFDISLIIEACNRTIQSIHQPSFEYTDSILKSWFDRKVHTINDVKQLDQQFDKNKKNTKSNTTKSTNKFNNYSQNSYDFDELEKKARERLFNQVNRK